MSASSIVDNSMVMTTPQSSKYFDQSYPQKRARKDANQTNTSITMSNDTTFGDATANFHNTIHNEASSQIKTQGENEETLVTSMLIPVSSNFKPMMTKAKESIFSVLDSILEDSELAGKAHKVTAFMAKASQNRAYCVARFDWRLLRKM